MIFNTAILIVLSGAYFWPWGSHVRHNKGHIKINTSIYTFFSLQNRSHSCGCGILMIIFYKCNMLQWQCWNTLLKAVSTFATLTSEYNCIPFRFCSVRTHRLHHNALLLFLYLVLLASLSVPTCTFFHLSQTIGVYYLWRFLQGAHYFYTNCLYARALIDNTCIIWLWPRMTEYDLRIFHDSFIWWINRSNILTPPGKSTLIIISWLLQRV